MTRALRLRIAGRVQGVGFRQSAVAAARRFGVCGWVRNAGDGSVEAEIEGPEEAVAAMLDWCRQGPHYARVDAVEETPLDSPPGHEGFRIRC